MPTSFRNAYRHLCNQLYKTILTNLGISFEQLRRATLPATGETSTDEIIASQRETIANILGIDESRLSELFFNVEQPPVSPSEDQLEQISLGIKALVEIRLKQALSLISSPGNGRNYNPFGKPRTGSLMPTVKTIGFLLLIQY